MAKKALRGNLALPKTERGNALAKIHQGEKARAADKQAYAALRHEKEKLEATIPKLMQEIDGVTAELTEKVKSDKLLCSKTEVK